MKTRRIEELALSKFDVKKCSFDKKVNQQESRSTKDELRQVENLDQRKKHRVDWSLFQSSVVRTLERQSSLYIMRYFSRRFILIDWKSSRIFVQIFLFFFSGPKSLWILLKISWSEYRVEKNELSIENSHSEIESLFDIDPMKMYRENKIFFVEISSSSMSTYVR